MSEQWEIIHSYTREQAIADGVLIDVTKTAREIGFAVPVALTSAVHEGCVVWDEDDPRPQDEAGRLWDVLWMAINAARRNADGHRVDFDVLRLPRFSPKVTRPQRVSLAMEVGPGDNGEPVMTIMMPDED